MINTLLHFFSKSSLLCYDYATSATLEEFLRDSRITLNLDVVLAIAIDLIYAILYMEQKGVVHNNITTANVLIARGQRVIFIYYNSFAHNTSTAASTNARNRDDPSENEIRGKHKHKQNHPNFPNCLIVAAR